MLTAVRLAAVIPFAVLLASAGHDPSWPAAIVFAAACLTDFLDGFLARHTDRPSRFGRNLSTTLRHQQLNSPWARNPMHRHRSSPTPLPDLPPPDRHLLRPERPSKASRDLILGRLYSDARSVETSASSSARSPTSA